MVFTSFSQPTNRFGFDFYDNIPVQKNGSLLEMPWVGGFNNPQFSKIDLDMDGVEDLFVFERSTNSIHPFLFVGTPGNPQYKYAPEYIKYFPGLRNWVLLRDYNCDGKKDIFANTPGGIQVFKNVSDDTLKFINVSNNSYLMTTHYGNYINLYVSSVDIPSITDIDGDGDLDILCFGLAGSAVQYHKNMSVENYGVCDSLEFEVVNDCWGRFTENSNNSNINLYDTLNYPCNGTTITNPQISINDEENRYSRHVGSTMLAFDENGSGVMDLILGDVDQTYLTLLNNGGIIPNTNSAMVTADASFPSYDQPVDVMLFPAPFYEDIDNDGEKDLIVSSNLQLNFSTIEDSWDNNNIWYYKNTGATNNPQFSFQENAFLQKDMIEVGRGAYPVLFDYNGDGLKDLFISNSTTSWPDISIKKTQIGLYENIGTATNPQFDFVSDNYSNIRQQNLGNDLAFNFGDLDGDGVEDMVLGNSAGELYWIENSGTGTGNAVFTNAAQVLNDKNGNPITVPGNAFPVLIDIDRNGTLDLIVGDVFGKLYYYSNTNSSGFDFTFETGTFGNVDVSRPNESFGYASPHFVDLNGDYQLFLGSRYGEIFYYNDIENNLGGTFNKVDTNVMVHHIGRRTNIWIEDLNGDDYFEAFLGNFRGGVELYRESDSITLSLDEHLNIAQPWCSIFPNPAKDEINISLSSSDSKSSEQTKVLLFDLNGALVRENSFFGNRHVLNTTNIENGIYILVVHAKSQILRQKVMLQH